MTSEAAATSPSRGRRSYAHGRKIHHIRFRVDGSIASHLFFIKTKTMKLRQLQQQAMQQAATKRQLVAAAAPAAADSTDKGEQQQKGQTAADNKKKTDNDTTLLNSQLQQLYKQGRLGDNPYIVQPPPKPAPPPPPPPPRRFSRPPQPVSARIPALKIDPGPYDDVIGQKEEAGQQQQQRTSQLHSRVENGRLVPLFDRDCTWYLYPDQLTMAAELGKKSGSGATESGPSIRGSAAEVLVRSRSLRAK